MDTAGELRGRRARVFNAIHSREGCREQRWHTDHDPVPLARMRRKPRSAIMALEAGAKLLIAVKGVVHEVRLEMGDILVFDGDGACMQVQHMPSQTHACMVTWTL
ncbi:hypothetical protein OAO87_01770 [bacterium]|nr:hypothetical protein [bacterium]